MCGHKTINMRDDEEYTKTSIQNICNRIVARKGNGTSPRRISTIKIRLSMFVTLLQRE